MTVMRFLATQLSLLWNAGTAENAAEKRRIGAVMAAHAGRPWAADLQAYRRHLAQGDRTLTLKTIRTYFTAAAGLMASAKVARATDLADRHARGFLVRQGGHRASLARFAAWL